jgi:hypothetical protein
VGGLLIKTEPAGANVSIDGKLIGVSPQESKGLLPGAHKVRVEKDGYETWEKESMVDVGKTTEILVKLGGKKTIDLNRAPKKLDTIPEKIDAPILNVGDYWVYETSTKGKSRIRVLDITREGFLLNNAVFDQVTFNENYRIENGKKVKNENLHRRIFDFPLYVGKKWKDAPLINSNAKLLDQRMVIVEFQVKGIEDIINAAGTFKSFLIFAKLSDPGRGNSWMKFWYSPKAKFWVRREYEKSNFWSRGVTDAVLFDYKLKD